MPKITENMLGLFKKREFVSIATADKAGQPNSVPRFFLCAKGDFIYLIDHVMGRTVFNINENPLVSVSFMDQDSLEGYRFNGSAKVLTGGKTYDAMLAEWNKRVVKLSAERVLEAIRTGKKRGHYEVEISEKFALLKIKVESVVKIGRRGDICQESP